MKNRGIFVQIAAEIALFCDPDFSRPDFDFQRAQPRCHGQRCARSFASIGDAANCAARLESLCKTLDEPILASGEFARHFEDRFASAGHHVLRGIDGEQEVFALRI